MTPVRRILAALVAVLTLASLTACSRSSQAAGAEQPLRVMAAAVPHAEIIKHLQETGALGSTRVELTEITGDIDPNQLLAAGDIDANFFQHVPYQDSWSQQHPGVELSAVASVHVEPLGLYSATVRDLKSIPQGASVALPNNVTNFARSLKLLDQAGLITLRDGATSDLGQLGEDDIAKNPHGLKFVQISAEQLPGSLDEGAITLSVINGNYALEAGLNPAKDALVLESATDNPYANVFTTTKALADDPRVKALAEALTTPETAAWIRQQYSGAVIPVTP